MVDLEIYLYRAAGQAKKALDRFYHGSLYLAHVREGMEMFIAKMLENALEKKIAPEDAVLHLREMAGLERPMPPGVPLAYLQRFGEVTYTPADQTATNGSG